MAITETLIVCPSCGRRYDEPTHFCVDCGTRLPDSGDASPPETEPENGSDTASTKPLWTVEAPDAKWSPPATPPPPTPVGNWSPPAMPPRPTTEPAQASPPSSAGKRSDRPILIGIALAATLVLVVLGVALYVGGVFRSTGPASPATSNAPASSVPTPSVAAPTPTPAPVPTVPRATPSPSPAVPPVVQAPGVTGRDASGFNVGSGCSDNPASPLPGCADSPSIPNGDSEGSCPNGITVDSQTTSCTVAESVRSNYTSDGLVSVSSPGGGPNYAFTCRTGGIGTTGFTICRARAGNGALYVRWHP